MFPEYMRVQPPLSAMPKYIQIINCGKFEFALWDFPNSHTFYPVHGTEDECVKWAVNSGYELVSENDQRMIWIFNKTI